MRICKKLFPFLNAALILAIPYAFLFPNSLLLPKKFRQWRFEARVKKHVNPDELQKWAVNLIKQHPVETEHYMDWLGTNIPPGSVLKIFNYRPMVGIGGDDQRASVSLLWAHAAAIHVGNTNFVDNDPEAVIWKPGIFFIPDAGGFW